MISFKEFLLIESPLNLYDIYNLSGFSNASKQHIDNILISNTTKHKFNKDYQYTLDNNYFSLYKDNALIFYIYFDLCGKDCMHIKMMDKKTDIKGISILVYHFILNTLKFKEIETGNKLSDKNIKAHKNMIGKILPYNMYIRSNGKDALINNTTDLDIQIKKNDTNSTFVIKESEYLLEYLLNLYLLDDNLMINDIIENIYII